MNRLQREARFNCRASRRHWMEQAAPLPTWRPPDSWRGAFAILHFECRRDGCEVWRHDAVDSAGELLTGGRSYDWPDWYKLDEDEQLTTAQYRLLMVTKQTALERKVQRAQRPKKRAAA
jgi:hypothetical protein